MATSSDVAAMRTRELGARALHPAFAEAHGRGDYSHGGTQFEEFGGVARREARRFLAGEDVKPSPAAPHKHDESQ
jgi:hypothetical protein